MLYPIVLVLVASTCALSLDENQKPDWSTFKLKYKKQYRDSEEIIRKSIWQANIETIEKRNKQADRGEISYRLAENQFADMTREEIRTTLHGFNMFEKNVDQPDIGFKVTPLAELPTEVDWRKKGAVTEVGNQGQCGSCWAFSANGALEAQHFFKTGKLMTLSAQNLMDCSQKEGNYGCSGGLMSYSFTYVKKNGGIDTNASYPYEGKDGKCRFTKAGIGATDTGFVRVPKGDEHAMQDVVANVGPVAVGMDGQNEEFEFYKSGIYGPSKCSNTTLNHAVTVVGYGTTDDGQDYWIAKNSFGTTWGMEGYVYMARNKDNRCGVASQTTYPTV